MGKIISNGIDYTGGGSSTLAGLSDVSLTTPVTGDALIYDGAEWANTPLNIPTKTSDLNNDSGFITSAAVPTKTSDLTNDSNFVSDASYVHTDNNYTTAEQTKLSNIESGAEVNVQSDWNQSDNTQDDFIKNKPTIPVVPTVDSNTIFIGYPIGGQNTYYSTCSKVGYNATTKKLSMQTKTDVSSTNIDEVLIPNETSDLTDVSINNLANGQILKYNSTSQKWENANESGGGSKHTILDESGTSLADEPNLQFLDARLADDNVNGATTVEIVHQLTKAQLNALGANTDGLYEVTDENDTLDASAVAYGNTDVEDALDDLYAKVNLTSWTEITNQCNFNSRTLWEAHVYQNSLLRMISFVIYVNGSVENQGGILNVPILPANANIRWLSQSTSHETSGTSVCLVVNGANWVCSSHSISQSVSQPRYSGLFVY